MIIKTKIFIYSLLKKVSFFQKIDDFVRRCITKKFFYSFCGVVFISNMIKFSASKEIKLNGEMDGWMFELFIDAQPQ